MSINERHDWADINNKDDREIVYITEATLLESAFKVIEQYKKGLLTFDELVYRLQVIGGNND